MVMDLIVFGWREVIFLLVTVAVIYLLVLLLKFTQIGRGKVAQPMQEPELDQGVTLELTAEQLVAEKTSGDQAPGTREWADAQALFGSMATASEPVAAVQPGGFGEHLAEHLARSEMEQEIQRLRTEMDRLRAQLEELRVARRVSPQYAEAMELAQRGLSAQAVADRMDISLAEAELVEALSRGDKNFKEGDEHGADVYAADDRNQEFDKRRDG